jgi:hypothetical protein
MKINSLRNNQAIKRISEETINSRKYKQAINKNQQAEASKTWRL